jgi:hypothetical protein
MFQAPFSFNLFSHDLFLRPNNNTAACTSSLNTDYLTTSPSPMKSKSSTAIPLGNNSHNKKRRRMSSVCKSSMKVRDLMLRQVNQSQIIEDLLKRGSQTGASAPQKP